MLAIQRKCSLKSGSGTSAAKPSHSFAKRMHSSVYFRTLNSDMALLPLRRERLPLSVVGGPIDGAGDGVEMGTSGLLSECYFPNLRARSRHQYPRVPLHPNP